jgi:hypothetical protein
VLLVACTGEVGSDASDATTTTDGSAEGTHAEGTTAGDVSAGETTGGTTAGDATVDETTTGDDGRRTLDNCGGAVDPAVAAFYQEYFDCSDITHTAAGTEVATEDLPPHQSPYWPMDDPNWVEFDDRGGTHHQNPNVLAAGDYRIVIPDEPVAKGITIDAGMIDNMMMTSPEEYAGGPQGVALDGVIVFAAMAAPGDDIDQEQFTFDLYEAHPAQTTYHYHFATPGPFEVLADRGDSGIELYGIMCDGTVVLGCTELDGSMPDDADFDAQNGHVHDIADGDATHFVARYHTHVCPELFPGYLFFPEIAYYETTTCPAPPGGM